MAYDVGPEQRKIIGMMVVTGVVGTVGTIVSPPKNAQGQTQQPGSVSPFRVILGVSIGSAMLVVISELGETGAQFAVGISTLAAMAALLLKGGPMFTAIFNAVGGTVGGQASPTAGSPTIQGISTTFVTPVVAGLPQPATAWGTTAPGAYTGTIPT